MFFESALFWWNVVYYVYYDFSIITYKINLCIIIFTKTYVLFCMALLFCSEKGHNWPSFVRLTTDAFQWVFDSDSARTFWLISNVIFKTKNVLFLAWTLCCSCKTWPNFAQWVKEAIFLNYLVNYQLSLLLTELIFRRRPHLQNTM